MSMNCKWTLVSRIDSW